MRTLIVHRVTRPLLALACVMALAIAAVPAAAAPIGGRARPADASTSATPVSPPVIRELHTVVRERDAGRTLSTALASVALLVASGAAAYSIVGVRRSRLSTQA